MISRINFKLKLNSNAPAASRDPRISSNIQVRSLIAFQCRPLPLAECTSVLTALLLCLPIRDTMYSTPHRAPQGKSMEQSNRGLCPSYEQMSSAMIFQCNNESLV